ncbi:MAG: hypothetical protein GXY52_00435 [Chloroflexi bacterium]|nr:hypothetical protein [Chloroflexota bacterium]
MSTLSKRIYLAWLLTAVAGISLLVAAIPALPVSSRSILVMIGALAAAGLCLLGQRLQPANWWLLPAGGALAVAALATPALSILPGNPWLIGGGLVLLGVCLGLAASDLIRPPELAKQVLVLVTAFGAIAGIEYGLGYRLQGVSMLAVILAYGAAAFGILRGRWLVLIASVLLIVAAMVAAPQPAAVFRLVLPLLLILAGLYTVRLSRQLAR